MQRLQVNAVAEDSRYWVREPLGGYFWIMSNPAGGVGSEGLERSWLEEDESAMGLLESAICRPGVCMCFGRDLGTILFPDGWYYLLANSGFAYITLKAGPGVDRYRTG